MKILLLSLLVLSVLSLSVAFKYDDDQDQPSSNEQFVDREEASEFLMEKRLLHPFSTKNEEIKRETREVYEEKCETVVPFGSRHCPEIKKWAAFKNYENGE